MMTIINGPDSSVVRGYGLGGGGPGFNPHHYKLSGLQIRPFKVSGGSPRPPPEQTPGNRVKNLEGKPAGSTKEKKIKMMAIDIYIYIYIHIHT